MAEPINSSVLMPNISPAIDDDLCTICLNSLSSDEVYNIPECSHIFHTNCIIPWFRKNSTCPCCRSGPSLEGEDGHNYFYWDNEAKYVFNRRFAQRKNAPKALKKLVERLRNKERKDRENIKNHREWLKSEDGIRFIELRKIDAKLKRQRGWRRWRRHSGLRAQIAQYPITPVLVPFRVQS